MATKSGINLIDGLNIIINNRLNGTDTPIYPITKTSNIIDTNGYSLDTLLSDLCKKEHGNHVPEYTDEIVSDIRFLRNDNTWATIQSASLTQPGIVKLSDATNLDDSTVAATAKAVKSVRDAVDSLSESVGEGFVKISTVGSPNGVASLDENGNIPANQLPSYVDDIIDVDMGEDYLSALDEDGKAVVPASGKIYVDCLGDSPTQKTYRWSGSSFVVISDTIALGETASTAFDGARGKVAYDHSQSQHARTDATKTENSATNGYIKINDEEVLVYSHPEVSGGSVTNPHGTTKADLGLEKVENKSSEEIIGQITDDDIIEKLGYTPANVATKATTTQDGIMGKEMVSKLNGCQEIIVSAEAPTFSSGSGLWFQVV